MRPLQLLPAALVAFVCASPVFAAPPTSTNDPFRALAAQVPRKPDPAVCCLKNMQPLEPLEDEVLLSFEEWKQKQSVQQEKERAKEREAHHHHRSTNNTGGKVSGENGNGSDTLVSQDIPGTGDAADVDDLTKAGPKTDPLPPHFRVPLVDRFNYASLECSARVRGSHRTAKSASSILSSKRDRYMLSPCNPPNKEKQFVVVELCEDIRIDTVQLANFEFFSGIFKDFRISVAKTEITNEKDWIDAGMFRAKNVRGIQSFHPPTSLRDFYRYIRIEFLSHYGNEYYCPVSLLRVYGLTHLEEWKWDMWEQESREALAVTASEEVQPPSAPADPAANPPIPGDVSEATSGTGSATTGDASVVNATGVTDDDATDSQAATTTVTKDTVQTASPSPPDPVRSTVAVAASVELATLSKTPDMKPSLSSSAPSPAEDIHDTPRTIGSISTSSSAVLSPSATNTSSTISQPNVSSTPVASHKASPSDADSHSASISSISRPATTNVSQATPGKVAGTTIITSMTSSVVVSVPAVSHSVVPVTTGGESIYRTIMNRLTALEGNHTLYARYVEQQTSGVRELIRRLGEDVGRLEGIGKAQSQMYQRTVRDWEKRQQQLQMDYGELMARVEYLSDEIVLEKRLGIAQLCLLLAVLVFMGLTRGSRGDQRPVQFNRAMREWGRRHLSFSGDWTTRFRGRGRSGSDARETPKPHPQSARPVSTEPDHDNAKFEFPKTEKRGEEKAPLKAANMNIRSFSSDARVQSWGKSRSRTPSMRSGARQHQLQHSHAPRPPSTPTTSHRPRLQRSNSHGGPAAALVGGGLSVPGSAHKSARKWARTAHLHEVRSVDSDARQRRARERERENEVVDVFASPGPDPFWVRKGGRGREGESEDAGTEEGDDAWVIGLGSQRKAKERQRGEGRLRFKKPPEESEADQWVDTDTDFEEGDRDRESKMENGGRQKDVLRRYRDAALDVRKMATALPKLLTSIFTCFGPRDSKREIRIAFLGPDVIEKTSIVQAMKTGEYTPVSSAAHSPSVDEVNVAGVNFTAVVMPSGHLRDARLLDQSRRSAGVHLSEFQGIVYVPILVLVRSGQLKEEEVTQLKSDVQKAKKDQEVSLRVYKVPWLREVDQGLQWLLDRV
ncbi:putative sad1 / UNC-like C-terminal [Lyophyllum shimeji]|uniref:Sad1 / UNC-like C-terminal n=1 Tax=Lyophyllum shimeji TaxID=47721 RepID=A0A9P3PLM7_LYOSH|nr:putative sad1 / UNC-like C-terminal [Lyophyllum shimeji]